MRLLRTRALAAVALVAAIAAGPAVAQDAKPAAGVAVTTPWARATPGGAKVGAAFLELSSKAGTPDKLVAARSAVANVVELHTHANEGGVMKMRKVDGIPVEAKGTTTLKPGGYHIMLIDLKQPLKEGESIDLTLVFEKAGEVAVKVPVLKVGSPGPGAKAGQGGGHGAHSKH